jgi:NADH:ubiquinone oxidoreductase subunit F (NADH-binding)
VQVVTGPDEYLFGEEKALLEVIEGGRPLPRILPPYQVGLFARRGARNPAVVNNVETLAHVTAVLRHGSAAFRRRGTPTSPGTMVVTLSGDVRRPGVRELPLGVPLRVLLDDVGGGAANGGGSRRSCRARRRGCSPRSGSTSRSTSTPCGRRDRAWARRGSSSTTTRPASSP